MKKSPSIDFPRQHRETGKSGEIDIVKFQKATKKRQKRKKKKNPSLSGFFFLKKQIVLTGNRG